MTGRSTLTGLLPGEFTCELIRPMIVKKARRMPMMMLAIEPMKLLVLPTDSPSQEASAGTG